MKKLSLSVVLMFTAMLALNAQDALDAVGGSTNTQSESNWKKGGSVALNFNNTGLSNWAAGGQSSVALGSIVDLYANYQKGKNNWTNTVNWAAGLSRVGDNTNLVKKSDDLLIAFSKYRRNIKPRWGLAAFAELRTQVFVGNQYRAFGEDSLGNEITVDGKREEKLNNYLSNLLSPGYLTTSIGWEYNRGKTFYVHATPLAGRATTVFDEAVFANNGIAEGENLYGVDFGKSINFQLGSLVRSGLVTELMENVKFSTTLMLFSPYDNYGNIDVTWETLTSFKINKFLTTTFSTQMLYYDDARPKVIINENGQEGTSHGIQFKHVLNIGFLAKF